MCYRSLCCTTIFFRRYKKTSIIPNDLLYLQKNQVLYPPHSKLTFFSEMHLNCFKYNKYKLLLVVTNAMRKSYNLALHEAVLPKIFFCPEQHKSNRNARIFSMAYTLQS